LVTLVLAFLLAASLGCPGGTTTTPSARETVWFSTSDGATIYADQYGDGNSGVVLAHGGRFNKESWERQARVLAQAGFRSLAIGFRGYGRSQGGGNEDYHFDVLAAAAYLRDTGATTVSVVGASFGGWAAARAACAAPGGIDRLVLLSASSIDYPECMGGRKLFVSTRNDIIGDGLPRFPLIQELYKKALGPKELLVLEGEAHAQHIFDTEEGERLMREILRFLSEPDTD
jgi:alpha/beta superfamily hydrolase